MASSINSTSTGSGGLVSQGDDSGILNIQTNETTAITVDASQRVAFVAGTAALPAITTDGDTNTGIYFPAADTIAFSEGGAESMRIDSSGNLLVGTTTSPSNSGNISALGAIKGGAVYQSSGFENGNYTLTTPATVYSFNKDQGGAGGSSTTTFNITGVSNVDGAFLFIYLRSSNTAGGINCGANIQVHGTQLFSAAVQNNTKTITFGAFRQNGSWVATASATGSQISAFP